MNSGARRVVIAAVALVSVANVALAADDSGVHAFLSNVFGEAGGAARPAVPARVGPSAPAVRMTTYRRDASYRPLTIRKQQPKVVAAMGPTKPAKVSIYNDPTMRRGDAVMTADGIRIFAGSRSWPYAKSDFVTLAAARDLDRDTAKVLASLNTLPRT